MQRPPTHLDAQKRGDTFKYSFTLGNSWLGSDFTGSVKWTLRRTAPKSSQTVDTDAIDQASVATGEITFVGAVGTIEIPASRTTAWPTGVFLWDLQGVIAGATPIVHTIDDGDIQVTADITRSL